jgi:hypothetical protein
MTNITVNMIRTAIVLSLAGLCFSATFSAIQYLPTVQAQTQASTPQPSIEELNIKMEQLSASNKPDDIATLR